MGGPGAPWGDPGEAGSCPPPAAAPGRSPLTGRPCQLPRGKCRTQAGRAGSTGKLEHTGSGWGAGNRAPVLPHSVGGGGGDNTSDLGGLSVTLTPRRRQLAGGQPARRLPVSLSSSGGVPQELQTDVGPGPPHQGPPPPPRPPPTKGLLSFGAGSPPGCRTGAPGEGQRAGGEPGVCRVSSFLQQPPPPLVLFNHFLFFFLLLLFAFLFYFSLLIFIF